MLAALPFTLKRLPSALKDAKQPKVRLAEATERLEAAVTWLEALKVEGAFPRTPEVYAAVAEVRAANAQVEDAKKVGLAETFTDASRRAASTRMSRMSAGVRWKMRRDTGSLKLGSRPHHGSFS